MSTNLGSLILELGLDDSKYKAQLAQAQKNGLAAARDIEKGFAKGALPKDFSLKVDVDDKRLFDLNDHFDLKEEHFGRLQKGFKRNPLAPEVDFSQLDELDDRLKSLDRIQRASQLKVKPAPVESSYVQPPKRVAPQRRTVEYISDRPADEGLLDSNRDIVLSNQQMVSAMTALTKSMQTSTQATNEMPIKLSKSIYVSSKESFGEKVLNLPARMLETVITGSLEGVGQQLSYDFTNGAVKYLEAKTGQSAETLGKGAARYGYARSKQAATVGAEALGYRGGLKEVAEDLDYLAKKVDAVVNPKNWVRKANELEELIVAVGEDTQIYRDPEAAKKRVANFFAPDLDELKGGAARVAGVGLRAAATPFRIRKRIELARSMELSKMLAETMEVPDIPDIKNKKAIALLSGGVNLEEGGTNTYFARNVVKKALGDDVETVPVPNAYSNDPNQFGQMGEFKKLLANFLADLTGNEEMRKMGDGMPLDKLLNVAVEVGLNPDAIMLDATRRAYEKKYGEDQQFIFAGTSAGTIAAEEATAIAERGGAKNVKGFGATLPMAGLTNTASNENFRAFVGNVDPMAMAMFGEQFVDFDAMSKSQQKIVKASLAQFPPFIAQLIESGMWEGVLAPSKNTEMVEGTGTAHHLGKFLADENVSKRLGQFLGMDLPTEYTGKDGTVAFKQYADMFGQFDALTRTLRMLQGDQSAFDEESAGKYSFVTPDLQLRKTYGPDQEKADLEYAAAEYSTNKRVKGSAREESEEFKSILGDLVAGVQGQMEPADVDALSARLMKIFGEAPQFDRALYSDIEKMVTGTTTFQQIAQAEGSKLSGQRPIEDLEKQRKVRKHPSQYREPEKLQIPSVVDLPEADLVTVPELPPLQLPDTTGKEMAISFVKGVGEGLGNVAETAGTALAASAEKGVVGLVNRLMRRVPGDPGSLDASAPTIEALSDIGPAQIAKASALGIEDAATVLGNVAKAGASAASALVKVAGSAGIALKGAQPAATEFIEGSRKKLTAAKGMLAEIQSPTSQLDESTLKKIRLLSGDSEGDQGYVGRLLAEVDDAIAQIPATDRMKPIEPNQLANLKSQIKKIEAELSKVTDILNQSDEVIEGEVVQQFSTATALPSTPQAQVKQLTAAQPPPNYNKQVRQLGQKFSTQLKTARETDSPELAQDILDSTDAARKALDDLLTNLGDNASDKLRNLVSATRQRITKSSKGAQKLVDAAPVGENVGAGLQSGLTGSITDVQSAADALAQAVIDQAEDTLGIQSPSKVFKKIGQYVVAGFNQGLEGFGVAKEIYDMADMYQTILRRAFDPGVVTSELEILKNALTEVLKLSAESGSAIGEVKTAAGRIANYPNEAIVNQYKKDVRGRSGQVAENLPNVNVPESAKKVVFVSSGFTGTKGKISHEIAGKAQAMAPKGVHTIPFENKGFDVSGTMDEAGLARVVMDAIIMPMKAVLKGGNDEALRLAKQAYAVKQQRPDVEVGFMGHSAGGLIVREAQEILRGMEVFTQALTIATPLLGSFKAIKSDTVSLMGEGDQLRRFSGQKEGIVPGVAGHFSPNYLDDSNEMRDLLTQYLSEGITPELINKIHTLGKAIKGLEPGKSGGVMKYNRRRSSGVGENLGDSVAKGLDSSAGEAVEAANHLADAVIEAVEDTFGIASPSKVFTKIGEYLAQGLAAGMAKGAALLDNPVGKLKDRATEGFKEWVKTPTQDEFVPFEVSTRRPEQDIPIIGDAYAMVLDSMESMKNAATFLPQMGRALGDVFTGLMANTGMMMSMAKGALLFNFVVKPLIGALTQFENVSFGVAVEMDNLGRMITFVSGSAREGGKNIDFIRGKVAELGGDVRASTEGFGQLAASAQGTRLEGEGTRQLFSAVSQASAVYQLDPQKQAQAYTALSQMMDKNVVSAEELRGQLAESLPSSIAVAARAMGVGTQEMGQMMQSGQILAEDLLPKFAQQLSAETSAGVAGSANSAQSAINSLNNETLLLQEAFGKTVMPVRVTGIKVASGGLKLLRENILAIAPALTVVFVTLMKSAAVSAIKFVGTFLMMPNLMGIITTAAGKMFSTLLVGLRTFAKQFALNFILIQGVIDLFAIFSKALGDSSGGLKDLAKSSTAGWEDYATTVGKAVEAQEDLAKSSRSSNRFLTNPVSRSTLAGLTIGTVIEIGKSAKEFFSAFKDGISVNNTLNDLAAGESLLEQSFVGAILPAEFSRIFERGTQKLLGLQTFEDRKADQQTIAVGELISSGGKTTSEAMRLRQGGSYQLESGGSGSITQVAELDRNLKNLQQQRSAIAPGDADGRRKIEEEINALIKERETLYQPLGKLQRNLTQDAENYKSALKIIEDELSRGGLSDDRRAQLEGQAAALNTELKLTEKQLDGINNVIGESVTKLELLSRSLRGIAADLAKAQFFNQLQAGAQNLSIAQARKNGATQGELEYSTKLAGEDQISAQIAANAEAINKFQATLADTEFTSALNNAGLDSNSFSAEIQAAIDNLQEGSLRTTLEGIVNYKSQLEGLQLDTVGLEEQLATVQAEAAEQIREANKQVTEFYREVENQSKELALQAKETAANTDFSSFKASLKNAMTGLSGSFFDDWIGGFVDFLDSIQNIVQTRIDADRQRMNLQQQQMQAQMQAQQLSRSLPGALPGTGGFSSPLAGRSIQDVIAYQPSQGQSFTAHRSRRSGPNVHGGIDFDSRVGGGAGAGVQAVQGGTAQVIKIGSSSEGDSVQVRVKFVDSQGREIEQRYNHLSGPSVQQALGIGPGGGSVQVQAGQSLGRVGATDNLSTGAHLDYKVRINGAMVDPQQYLAALNNGGGSIRAIGGGNVSVAAANAPASPRQPATASNLTVKGQAATQEQIGLAQRIYQVGSGLGANNREIQAAIATAIQESVLTNIRGGDRDSSGIFQQRPSMEWGTPGQIQNPDFAIESFFTGRGSNPGMIDNRGRAGGDVYQQSHLTQRSAHPDAPRQWDGEAAALLRAVSGGGGAAPGLNTGQFASAQGLQSQNSALETQLINQQEQINLQLANIQAEATANGLLARGNDQLRAIEDQGRDLMQQAEDRALALLPDSEIKSRAASIIETARSAQTETLGLSRQLVDSTQALDGAQTALSEIQNKRAEVAQLVADGVVEEGALAKYDQLQAQLETLITDQTKLDAKIRETLEASTGDIADSMIAQLSEQLRESQNASEDVDPIIAATKELRDQIRALEEDSDTLITATAQNLQAMGMPEERIIEIIGLLEDVNNQDLENLNDEVRKLTGSLEAAQEAAMISIRSEGLQELTRVLNRSGQGGQARELNYDLQRRQIENETATELARIDEDTTLNSAQKEQARTETRETGANRLLNAEFDYEISNQSADRDSRRSVLDSRQGLLGAQQTQADMLGFGGVAPLKQQEMNLALEEQAINYEQQLADLYELQDATGMTTEAFAEMQAAIEQTNQLSVDNIKTQFSDLPEIVGAIKQPMTDALSSWIDGSKSFGEAFNDMLSNILGNLVSMMANKAIEGLLGSLLGGVGGSGAGEVGGIASGGGGGIMGIVGSLFGGLFSDGGRVGVDGYIPNYMSGGVLGGKDPIKDAMKREGPGAKLIVANTSEWVLNRHHQDILRSYGVDERVLGFKDGGVIGGGRSIPAMRNPAPGNTTVNVPITVNSSGGESGNDGAELARRLADPIKALVTSEVARMQKPGGQLRSRK